MNLNELPEDDLERLKVYRSTRQQEEREKVRNLKARYAEGLPLTEREWTILSFTPAPDGLASGCGY